MSAKRPQGYGGEYAGLVEAFLRDQHELETTGLFGYIACEESSRDPEHPSGRCANTAFIWCTLLDKLVCFDHARGADHYAHQAKAHPKRTEASEERLARAKVYLPMLPAGTTD